MFILVFISFLDYFFFQTLIYMKYYWTCFCVDLKSSLSNYNSNTKMILFFDSVVNAFPSASASEYFLKEWEFDIKILLFVSNGAILSICCMKWWTRYHNAHINHIVLAKVNFALYTVPFSFHFLGLSVFFSFLFFFCLKLKKKIKFKSMQCKGHVLNVVQAKYWPLCVDIQSHIYFSISKHKNMMMILLVGCNYGCRWKRFPPWKYWRSENVGKCTWKQ